MKTLVQEELREFFEFGKKTQVEEFSGFGIRIPVFINEFWTAKQRAGNSLHQVSYRACFKPQLPRFFIERLTDVGDVVYDPFMGRGTTLLEVALCGRIPFGCDINPLSKILLMPRLRPPRIEEVSQRLDELDFSSFNEEVSRELLTFYHPDTLRQIHSLRHYFIHRKSRGELDDVDAWISAMRDVFCELHRILTPGGYIAFEVGEVLGGKLQMENLVIPASSAAGLRAELILINDQKFTKTANCWGIKNQKKGTNTNRVVLLKKLETSGLKPDSRLEKKDR